MPAHKHCDAHRDGYQDRNALQFPERHPFGNGVPDGDGHAHPDPRSLSHAYGHTHGDSPPEQTPLAAPHWLDERTVSPTPDAVHLDFIWLSDDVCSQGRAEMPTTGGTLVLYVRELDRSEKRVLQNWLQVDDDELRHRARVVLLSSEGYRIPEIGRILGAHPANLRKWIHRFNDESLRGLVSSRSGGAKPRFSEDQKARIVALAKADPRSLGFGFSTWTLHRLADAARRRNIVDRISHEYIRQILRDADCSYKHADS